MKDFANYWKALTWATANYGDLERKSKIPYIVHPLRITLILRAAGLSEFKDEEIMIAALFHDLVEDTNTTLEEIKNQFGAKIALIVKEVTKPKKENKEEWLKNFGNASKEAKIIKMADRIDNLMEMEMWSVAKQKAYAEEGKIILQQCRDAYVKLARRLKEVIETILAL